MKTRKNLNNFLVMLVFLLATLCTAAAGGTLYVPGVHSTIQDAIDAADDGDEIEVAPGIYFEKINFKGKTVRLYSSGGPQVTKIDATSLNASVVICESGEGPGTILEGFNITGGSADNGGGMYNVNSSPTVTNCTFSGNSAMWGGGMFNRDNSPTLTGCTFSDNSSVNWGGGMYNYTNSSPTVTNCTFTGNVADAGGGMHNSEDCNPTLTNCMFMDNSAGTSGGMHNWKSSPIVIGCTFSGNSGGMRNDNNCSPTVIDCTFTDNSTDGSGGGMSNTGNSNPIVTNCTFSGNSALIYSGGGMHNWQSSPTVTGCTFSNNSGDFSGGMYNGKSSSPIVIDCTFIGNSASAHGGGLFNSDNSNPTIRNCTFNANSAGSNSKDGRGGGLYNQNNSSPTVTGCTFSSNVAYLGGGMCNNDYSSPNVTDCVFTDNSITTQWGGGGGMRNDYHCSPTVIGCTFSGNSASYDGGGMRNQYYSSPTVTNCTFTDNSTDGSGGGISNAHDSNPEVTNCILWADTAPTGVEIYNDGSSSANVSYTDVQGGTGQPWFGTGCIDADPFFADSDGRLSAGSPCIDTGNNSAVTVTTDLDGNPRIVGLAVDMGAYEFQEPTQHAAAKTEQLIDEVVVLNLQEGIENSLDSKLDAVSKALDDVNQSNDIAAINALQAFINSVEAQRGKKISEAEADVLIANAQEIIDLLLS